MLVCGALNILLKNLGKFGENRPKRTELILATLPNDTLVFHSPNFNPFITRSEVLCGAEKFFSVRGDGMVSVTRIA